MQRWLNDQAKMVMSTTRRRRASPCSFPAIFGYITVNCEVEQGVRDKTEKIGLQNTHFTHASTVCNAKQKLHFYWQIARLSKGQYFKFFLFQTHSFAFSRFRPVWGEWGDALQLLVYWLTAIPVFLDAIEVRRDSEMATYQCRYFSIEM